jgi:glycosyltransferase involved in cell wall biosynthesis
MKDDSSTPIVAVLIPCLNEEIAIERVIKSFKDALPYAHIHVFDNNSTDNTIYVAQNAGATVHTVSLQGKGNVVRQMFADIDADAFLLVDGDGTYHAGNAAEMVHTLFNHQLDMVVAKRNTSDNNAYRSGHQFGNWFLSESVAKLFGRSFTDILSGYRVFSKRFVKSFPANATGFEIETELTIHALELRMSVEEVDSPYNARPAGSFSKLNTYRDGVRIFYTILKLYRTERPMQFFGVIGLIFAMSAALFAIPIFQTYFETGLVPKLPTAVLVTGLGLSAIVSFFCGLILDTVTRGRQEVKRLAYLRIAPPKKLQLTLNSTFEMDSINF